MTKQTAAIVDDQAEWFNRNMLKIVRQVRNRLTAELNKFDRSGGNLESTPANIQRLNQIYGSIMTELQNAGYGDIVQQLQAKEGDLLKSIRDSRPAGTVPIAFTETSRDALAGFNSLFNQQFGGLAQSVARDIAGAVGNSIFGTQRVDTVMKEVARLLDDKFARYAATYVNTSRAQFIQAAEYESAKGYDGELYWIYEGPEDDITRPICRVGTGMDADGAYPNAPYFTESERLSFEAESAGLRMYNCRHSFMQISEEYYNENVGGEAQKSTIDDRILNASTPQDFENILSEFGVNNPKVFLDGDDSITNARRTTKAISEIKERYGERITNLPARITINDPSWNTKTANASCYPEDSRIHTKDLSDENKRWQSKNAADLMASGERKWSLSGGNPYISMIHEYGHAIDNKIVGLDADMNMRVKQSFKNMKDKEKALKQELKNVHWPYGEAEKQQRRKTRADLAKVLTEYGMKSEAEYLAESFAAWHTKRFDIMDKDMIDLFNEILGKR